MPDAKFLPANSLFIENLFRHAFLYEISRELLLQDPPRKLTVLNSEVDDSGVDIVLMLGTVTRHVQMKTLNKRMAPNGYNIADSVFQIPGGCVIWLRYDQESMTPVNYHFFGKQGNGILGNQDDFEVGRRKKGSTWVDRPGYRWVKTSHATHKDRSISELCAILFGEEE